MPPRTRPLTDQDRSTLLQFEALYEQWRVAQETLSASERRLWFDSFHALDAEELRTLGAETVRLRAATREAYASLISLLERSD